MIKCHFIFDNIKKNKKIKKSFLKKYKNYPLNLSNTIAVVGGDGYMLHSLKKYQKYNKAFYGINRGTFGFLMNKFRAKNIIKVSQKLKNFIFHHYKLKL